MRTPTLKDIKDIEYIGSCVNMSRYKMEDLMNGTTKANGKNIRMIIRHFMPEFDSELMFDYYNPFEQQSVKKEGLLVYVHSAIEYFFRIKTR